MKFKFRYGKDLGKYFFINSSRLEMQMGQSRVRKAGAGDAYSSNLFVRALKFHKSCT